MTLSITPEWQRVVSYLKAVNKDILHLRVPFATEP